MITGSAVIDFSISWIKRHQRMCIPSLLAQCPEKSPGYNLSFHGDTSEVGQHELRDNEARVTSARYVMEELGT